VARSARRVPRKVTHVTARLVVVGGGRMGEALVAGLLQTGWAKADQIVVAEKLASRREELQASHPNLEVVASPVSGEGAVIAVKPSDVEEACRAVAAVGVSRVLSIAAGVRLSRLEAWLGDGRLSLIHI